MESNAVIEESKLEIKRRDFLKGAIIGAMGMTSMTSLIGCVQEGEAEGVNASEGAQGEQQIAQSEGVIATPEMIATLGGSIMSPYELNKRRRELIDSKDDFVCEDGTVIPAVWNKLRALVNSLSFGCGSEMTDEAFEWFQFLMTEEEAQAYIEMPYGVDFSAADFSAESGRDEEECLAICEDLSRRGILFRTRRGGIAYFHHVPVAHGIFEYGVLVDFINGGEDGWAEAFRTTNTFGMHEGAAHGSGTPLYYAIPCTKEVVSDGSILIHDDYAEMIRRATTIGVSPCQCKLLGLVTAGEEVPPIGSEELKTYMSPHCGHALETCMSFGEEAEYYIENGIARQIDQEEAFAIMERSLEAGMIFHSSFAKEVTVVCHCHGDCCGILKTTLAFADEYGVEACESEITSWQSWSHYILNYDKDICLKCGSCETRCPVFAIEKDDEGYPTVKANCTQCGQCGTVCPVHARTLSAKPKDKILDLPENVLGDINLKAAYRFEHDMIY